MNDWRGDWEAKYDQRMIELQQERRPIIGRAWEFVDDTGRRGHMIRYESDRGGIANPNHVFQYGNWIGAHLHVNGKIYGIDGKIVGEDLDFFSS